MSTRWYDMIYLSDHTISYLNSRDNIDANSQKFFKLQKWIETAANIK